MSTDAKSIDSGMTGGVLSAKVVLAVHGAGYAGTERHVRSLATGLRSRGWDIELVASNDGPLMDAARAAGVPAHLVMRQSKAAYLRRLIRLLRALKPAVLHTHSGLLPALAARCAGVRTVIETRHGLPGRLNAIMNRPTAGRAWDLWSWRLADRTLTVCDADAEWLTLHRGIPPHRITSIANGLPCIVSDQKEVAERRAALRAQWGAEEKTLVLGFIGRLSEEKAPERLLGLLAWLDERAGCNAPQCMLVVAGEGPEAAKLKTRSATMSIGHRIRWLGVVPEASQILPGMDHLLICSHYEGMPYVALEALQAGVPVTATPVGGLPEVMNRKPLEDGLLAFSTEAWGLRILDFNRDRVKSAAWSDAARSCALDLSEDRMLDRISGVYRALLTGLRPRRSLRVQSPNEEPDRD